MEGLKIGDKVMLRGEKLKLVDIDCDLHFFETGDGAEHVILTQEDIILSNVYIEEYLLIKTASGGYSPNRLPLREHNVDCSKCRHFYGYAGKTKVKVGFCTEFHTFMEEQDWKDYCGDFDKYTSEEWEEF